MRFVLPLLSASFAVFACEPSPYPDDFDEMAARWSAARLAFVERCVTPHTLLGEFGQDAEPTLASMEPAPEGAAEIEAALRRRFTETQTLDVAAFERCVSAHEAIGAIGDPSLCPDDPFAFFVRAGCATMFVGARTESQGCANDGACSPGLFCDQPAFNECGRCAPDLRGPSPVEDLCADDPLCGLSPAPVEAGAACTSSCGNGPYPALACIEGVCVERRVADVGEACDSPMLETPWLMRSTRHCRDSDFGSTTCVVARIETFEGTCGPVLQGDPGGTVGAFVPGAGAAVIGTAAGNGGFGEGLVCAP